MKLILITGLLILCGLAQAQTCKYALYNPYGQFVTSVRTGNDPDCSKAIQACQNWRSWYLAPSNSRCVRIRDDGMAVIDYVRYPDYDTYYGYPGSPYYGVPRIPQTPSTTRYCYESRGRRTCYDVPAGYRLVCEEYTDGSERCFYEAIRPQTNPQPRPQPRPETRPAPSPTTPTTPAPNPNTNPMPRPRPETNTTPAPTTPTPMPTPTPAPATDATRAIEAGETVIYNNALYMVVSAANNNSYNLKPITGRSRDQVKNVARENVSVTRGCNVGFCANDSVINLVTSEYAAIAGLEYDGQLVIKTVDGTDKMTFNVNPATLAWTKGCSPESSAKVCVGNVVMKRSNTINSYYTVVGIQLDGNVVIEENENARKLILNIEPRELIITR